MGACLLLKVIPQRELFFGWSLLIVVLLSGCNSAQIGNYRLLKINDEMVILPPPYSNHSETKKISIHFPIAAGTYRTPKSNCSAKIGLFELSLKGGSSSEGVGTLPSLHVWQESVASGIFDGEFDHFLDEIGRLTDNGCLPSDRGAMLAEAVRESIPIRVNETNYYRYGYRIGTGYIDLEPGLRLKIVRADFDSLGKYQETSTVYYQIRRDATQAIGFQLENTRSKEAGPASAPDRTLAARDSGMFYGRLFFLGKRVPPNLNYAAVVVGTRRRAPLEEFTRTIQMRPEIGCSASTGDEIACVPFQGSVSVSAEIEVSLNGSRVSLEPRDTVRDLLSMTNNTGCQSKVRSLRIEREFLKKLMPVDFDSSGDSILDLVLVGGDHITCSDG